ncbi:hypothetical protein BBJ66_21545 [Rhizobium sp. RSm-3]|nr:hypothetical protein BBJ66_21545 [Rhizobium sp. RSm-3]
MLQILDESQPLQPDFGMVTMTSAPAVASFSSFSAIQEMLEVDLRDRVGVDASIDEAASVEAAPKRRVVMQAVRIRRAASQGACLRHAPPERLVVSSQEDRIGIDPDAAVGLIV